MGTGLGMRGKDLRTFLQVADRYGVIILVRQTNEDSLKYVGRAGFYPKPAILKAKTADLDPPPRSTLVRGVKHVVAHRVAGLVVHPGFQPGAYASKKVSKAQQCWDDTLASLGPTLVGKPVDLSKPDSWSPWGVDRVAANGSAWRWRVDVDPLSEQFGCIQLQRPGHPWCYIHGDYDLKDVIVVGSESDNRRLEGKVDGVKNYTPLLVGHEFETIRHELNGRMGVEMVQHGAEAQFAWHGDEPIVAAFPGFRHLTLLSAETVQGWYQQLNREVLAKPTTDWQKDRSRMFHFGPEGIFKPGALPATTWG